MERKLIFIDQIKEAGRGRGEKKKKKADRCILVNIIPIIGAPNSNLLFIYFFTTFHFELASLDRSDVHGWVHVKSWITFKSYKKRRSKPFG